MNNLEALLKLIRKNPEIVEFEYVIDFIDSNYKYTATRFTSGPTDGQDSEYVINGAGENEGSCKIFSFAQKHGLNKAETLSCFGRYYRDEVLNHPENSDHANIRTFIRYGWEYICFDKPALD